MGQVDQSSVIDWVVSYEDGNYCLYEKLPAHLIIDIEGSGGIVLLEENNSTPPENWAQLAAEEYERKWMRG